MQSAHVILAILCGAVGRVAAQEPADSDGSLYARLFDVNEPLNVQLAADFEAINKERGTTKHDHPGVMTYVSPPGDSVSLDVQLHTRGHFRLKTCQFPPLKIDFHPDATAHTLFAHHKSVKIVVQCRSGHSNANYLLEEYLLYRTYNLLTDLSFRVRLAAVTYINPQKPDRPETRYGFFLEDDDHMAHRNHGHVDTLPYMSQEEMNFAQMGLLGVFEYLIGNTDWSVQAMHNIVHVRDSAGKIFPVPYDFDWSGVISAPYAFPDPSLGIRTVRERVFRTECRTPAELAPIFAQFNSKKDVIYALYREQPGLEAKRVKQTLDYYDDFYRMINDTAAARRAFGVTCQGR